MKIEHSQHTDVGVKRDHNEDFLLVNEDLNLFIVCDGMGGHNAGEVASQMTAHLIQDYLLKQVSLINDYKAAPSNLKIRSLKDVVKDSINFACAEVYKEALNDSEKTGMGTTLVMVLIVNSVAIVAHVGDSRVYLIREKKEIQITEDHSFVNEMVKEGILPPDQAESHPNANVITRAVGIQEFTKPDVISIELMPKDSLILCSDGLSGYLRKGELLKFNNEKSLETLSDSLCQLANKRGGKDNVTVVSVLFGAAGSPPVHPSIVSASDKEKVLQQIPLFRKLVFKELALLLEITELKTFPAGEYLIKENTPGEEMFVIVKGEVSVENQANHITDLKNGSFFGEMSLIDNRDRNASIKANIETTTIVIHRSILFELFKKHNRIGVKILWALIQNMNKRLRTSDQKIFGLQKYFADLDPEISEEIKKLDIS